MIKWFMDLMDKAAQKNCIGIPNSETDTFFVAIQTYKGKPIELQDGAIIKKGDTIAELHVNNSQMNELDGNLRQIFKLISTEFALLAKASQEQEDFKKIKAYYGRGVLYPLIVKKGFEVRDISSIRLRIFLRIWDNLIKSVYSSSKRGRNKLRVPKESWASRELFIKKNGRSNND